MILWKGKEIEGQFKGLKTLFIGSDTIESNEISTILKEDEDIKQLYFGAGVCTKINEELLRFCVDNFKSKIISAEISLDDLHIYSKDLLSVIFIIVVITHKNFYLMKYLEQNNLQVKIQTLEPKENKFLSVGQYRFFIGTEMGTHQGKIYDGDEVLR